VLNHAGSVDAGNVSTAYVLGLFFFPLQANLSWAIVWFASAAVVAALWLTSVGSSCCC